MLIRRKNVIITGHLVELTQRSLWETADRQMSSLEPAQRANQDVVDVMCACAEAK